LVLPRGAGQDQHQERRGTIRKKVKNRESEQRGEERRLGHFKKPNQSSSKKKNILGSDEVSFQEYEFQEGENNQR